MDTKSKEPIKSDRSKPPTTCDPDFTYDTKILNTNIIVYELKYCKTLHTLVRDVDYYILYVKINDKEKRVMTSHSYVKKLIKTIQETNSPVACRIIKTGQGTGTRYVLEPPTEPI